MKSWRPKKWPKCPCDECDRKLIDDYGYFCDLACGERTAWLNREAGADAMLEALKEKGAFIPGMQAGADDSMLKFSVPNDRGWLVFIPEGGKDE